MQATFLRQCHGSSAMIEPTPGASASFVNENFAAPDSSRPSRSTSGTIETRRSPTAHGIERADGRFARIHFVWNARNAVDRFLSVTETTATWTYATASWRPARNVTSNSFEYVTGDVSALDVFVHSLAVGSAAGLIASVGVGVDSTTTNSAQVFGRGTETASTGPGSTNAAYRGYTVAGHHTITWLEMAGATVTFYGQNGSPVWETSGMTGRILA